MTQNENSKFVIVYLTCLLIYWLPWKSIERYVTMSKSFLLELMILVLKKTQVAEYLKDIFISHCPKITQI